MGGLAVSGVWLLTRTDGLSCHYGGVVNAGSRACVESAPHAANRATGFVHQRSTEGVDLGARTVLGTTRHDEKLPWPERTVAFAHLDFQLAVRSRRPHPPGRRYGQRQGTGHARPALPTVSGLAAEGITGRWAGRSRLPPGQEAAVTATRAPGGRGERSVGWRVRVVPGLGEIAPVFVSEGDLNTRVADAPASHDREPPRRLVSRSHVSIRAHVGELVPGGILHIDGGQIAGH